MRSFQIVFLLLLCLVGLPLSHATVFGWGKNDAGQLGMGHSTVVTTPAPIPFFSGVVLRDALTAINYIIYMADNSTVYGSGLQFFGQFATGTTSTTATTTPILCPFLNRSLDIVLPGTSCNANFNTNLLGWGNVASYVLGRETGYFPRIQVALPAYRFDGKVLSVHSVFEGVIVRLANNTVWAAGNNVAGQLGIGSTTSTYKFVQVNFWKTVTLQQVFSSQSKHICGLSSARSLYCWGANAYGQLGTKDTISYNVPTLVSFFDENRFEVYKVSYGDEFTVVLTCGGRVFTFGNNVRGQLGRAKSTGPNNPILTPILLEGVADITTGLYQTYARKTDNKWFVWGGIASGGLGLSSGSDLVTPTEHTFLKSNGINRIKSSSQSANFVGFDDDSVNNDKLSCPTLVNECNLGTHACDSHAVCSDYERGYMCTCIDGYSGDGFLTGSGCINDNSCAKRPDLCDNNAICSDSPEGPYCTCSAGFTGNGTAGNCFDIDECSPGNTCGPNTVCVNTVPLYYCECKPDYIGDDPYYEGCALSCQAGEYSAHNSCIPCPQGYYSESSTTAHCIPCPAGTYSEVEGLSSVSGCIPCGVGGYAGLGARYCSLCVHGYTNDPLVPNSDNSTCFPCALGTFGYYGQCYSCDYGQYSVEPAAKRCQLCAPGYFVAQEGSLECQPCPAGYKSPGGTQGCTICPAGYYSPEGSKDCFKCPPGTSTNGTAGQSTCSKCPVGYFTARSAAPVCYTCAVGYYADKNGTAVCKRCPRGTFANSQGSAECTVCEDGTYAPGTAATKCLNCDSGSKSNPDGTSCIPCDAGEYFSSDSGECASCEPGTFTAVSGSSSCSACSAGSHAPESGASFCKRCPVNTYSNSTTGFTSCTPCPSGLKSSGGASSCS